jgi:hypothetical protein
MIRLSGVSGEHEEQPAQRHDADQMPALVHDVEIEHHLHFAVALQLGDRVANRDVFAEREDIRVHDAAGGALLVLEQMLDDARFPRAHQIEDRVGQIFRQGVDQRGGVVGRNLLRQLRDLLGRARGEKSPSSLVTERTRVGPHLHPSPRRPLSGPPAG